MYDFTYLLHNMLFQIFRLNWKLKNQVKTILHGGVLETYLELWNQQNLSILGTLKPTMYFDVIKFEVDKFHINLT